MTLGVAMEHSAIISGIIMDCYAGPAMKIYLNPFAAVLDIEHEAAALPGSGDIPITTNHTPDLAKYVSVILDLEK